MVLFHVSGRHCKGITEKMAEHCLLKKQVAGALYVFLKKRVLKTCLLTSRNCQTFGCGLTVCQENKIQLSAFLLIVLQRNCFEDVRVEENIWFMRKS